MSGRQRCTLSSISHPNPWHRFATSWLSSTFLWARPQPSVGDTADATARVAPVAAGCWPNAESPTSRAADCLQNHPAIHSRVGFLLLVTFAQMASFEELLIQSSCC